MYADDSLAVASVPGVGFMVPMDGCAVAVERGQRLAATMGALRARHALVVLDCAPARMPEPMLVAFGEVGAQPGFGFLLCTTTRPDAPQAPLGTFCHGLAALAARDVLAQEAFAGTARALRDAYNAQGQARRIGRRLDERTRARVLAFVERELPRAIRVQDLADLCGVSSSSFTRSFRVTQGVTPRQWIIQRRVARARTMMASSALALIDVAMACGFSEQSHFNRQFRKVVGVSPGVWRRELGLAATGREGRNGP